jgi:hypothetical protein
MTVSAAGVSFRETMSGGFALGETDPSAGARRGAEEATPLVLRASLSIADVRVFVGDASHEGALDGTISFRPIAMAMPADSGRFRLFTKAADPTLKLMEYVVTFRHGNDAYCLSGAKEVRYGSPLRGWHDTTTLPCRLYAGTDPEGRVLGAGVLRISLLGFARQLLSFRAVNGDARGAKVRALAGFCRFFAGELLDSYLYPRAAQRYRGAR